MMSFMCHTNPKCFWCDEGNTGGHSGDYHIQLEVIIPVIPRDACSRRSGPAQSPIKTSKDVFAIGWKNVRWILSVSCYEAGVSQSNNRRNCVHVLCHRDKILNVHVWSSSSYLHVSYFGQPEARTRASQSSQAEGLVSMAPMS
ncbi:hypothetical protein ABKN59_006920 [Abortiporus biennis]